MEHLHALEAAIVYIEEHLGDPITVEDAAHHAGYSYYHLTRLFTATLGEPVGSYIKKRRLADAAKKLLYTDRRVLDIALDYGFESAEGFSRAFKAIYGVSPIHYRKNRLDLFIGAKGQVDAALLRHLATGITVQPRIEEVPDIHIVGLRGETTLSDNTIPQLWARFMARRAEIPGVRPDSRGFGVCENQNTSYSMDGDALFKEAVGAEVEALPATLPDGMIAKTIKGGRFAVFTHRGTLHNLTRTYAYIWGTWFLVTKEQVDNTREDFELYDDRYLGFDHPESAFDIYIPIK